ncbi:MAG: hypothetical protein CBD74_14795 [Saprospirales bacterium TMED214]|nr:MAG: hypothetical protein CBD74_14795 [Saprospirales bacterium TMED214]
MSCHENHEGSENCKDQKGMLDHVQEKVVSRKLLVFITATGLMWFGLDPDTWAMIAAMYIGGQSVIDVAKVWKGM